jgi:hypothetical protein
MLPDVQRCGVCGAFGRGWPADVGFVALMRLLDQIPAGASTTPPGAPALSSLTYAPRQRAGSVSGALTASSAAAHVAASPITDAPTGFFSASPNTAKLSAKAAQGSDGAALSSSTPGAAAQSLAAPFVRLVPSSGVQFLDFTIGTDGLSRTVGQFTEDHIESECGQRTVLVDVGRDAGDDGVVWHPLTKRPLGPEEFLTISGFAGLEPFLDTWVPLPYLRFRGRTPAGLAIHDGGPSNWVRAFIASPKEGLRTATKLSVVLAFDTKLAPVYATGEAADVGPSAYDALFGSTFQINDKLVDLGMFVSDPWVDAWLQGNFNDFVRRTTGNRGRPVAAAPSRFQLEHVARYLTYLAVLTRGTTLPQIRFADSFSNAWQMPVTGVDLVLDMAAEQTCALLIRRDAAAHGQDGFADAVMAGAEPLCLRDMNDPVRVHINPPSTTLEFDSQTFGNVVASRRSGRTDAFLWPSLVRVGSEAERLALRTSSTPGVTGRHGLFAGLNEIVISESVWRFSRDDVAGVDQGPIVAGEALSHMTEDGTVLGRFDDTGVPAIRPRFSESSLIGLFVGELLMHALVQINRPQVAVSPGLSTVVSAPHNDAAPSTEASAGSVHQLQRILVTVASAVSDEDRRLLQSRIEGAIDLIWKAMRWDEEATVASPPKPQVSLGIGSDVAAQLVYVFDEIRSRFGGDAAEYLHTLRRPTSPHPQSASERASNVFRIARLDFEAASTGLTVVDYEVADDGGVRPHVIEAERNLAGRDRVVASFADGEVWPAIAGELQKAGMPDAHGFIAALMADGASSSAGALPAHFARRFDGKIIRPAAESCLRSCETTSARNVDVARAYTLNALVERGGGRLAGLGHHFNAAAMAAGAVAFRLEDVTVRVRQRHAAELISKALEPVTAPFCALIAAQACDLVLIEGRLGQLPDLVDELRRRIGLPAHCIVEMSRHVPTTVGPHGGIGHHGQRNMHQSRFMGAVGAYLASQQAIGGGRLKLDTTQVAASLRHFQPAAIARSGRVPRLLTNATHSVLPPPLAADGSGGRTQGTLVRVNAGELSAASHELDGGGADSEVLYGAPRRRYAGAERDQ